MPKIFETPDYHEQNTNTYLQVRVSYEYAKRRGKYGYLKIL